MKDYLKPAQRLSFCRRSSITIDQIAWAFVGAMAFMLITAFLGIKIGLGAGVVFISGWFVKCHLDKRQGRS